MTTNATSEAIKKLDATDPGWWRSGVEGMEQMAPMTTDHTRTARERAEGLAEKNYPYKVTYDRSDMLRAFITGFLARDAELNTATEVRESENLSIWRDRRDKGSWQWTWGEFQYHPDHGGRGITMTPEDAARKYGPLRLAERQPVRRAIEAARCEPDSERGCKRDPRCTNFTNCTPAREGDPA